MDRRILIGLTGASGSIYAERLVEILLPVVPRIYLVATDAAREVARHELKKKVEGFSLLRALEGEFTDTERNVIRMFRQDDLFAPVASGSSVPTNMVILPCSMGTLGRVAQGFSGNLLERSADVVLKQKKQLIISQTGLLKLFRGKKECRLPLNRNSASPQSL